MFWGQLGGYFHTDLATHSAFVALANLRYINALNNNNNNNNPATVGAVRWPSAGDTAGYRVRRLKLTPVHSILVVVCAEVADNYGLFTVER